MSPHRPLHSLSSEMVSLFFVLQLLLFSCAVEGRLAKQLGQGSQGGRTLYRVGLLQAPTA